MRSDSGKYLIMRQDYIRDLGDNQRNTANQLSNFTVRRKESARVKKSI